jgi:predicted Fe-Mo cluster-binding NifX family protein
MKVAFSSLGKDINSKLSEVFGRCSYFIFVEIKNNKIQKIEAVENKSANQINGAGISAAQAVAEKDVNVVIAGSVGPRALDVLKQFNIQVYSGAGLIKEIIQKFIEGKLKKIQ